MKGFKNANVYVENLGVIKTDIGFENGKIAKIGNIENLEEIAKLSDSQVVVAGFIDEHIHGANDFDAMDGKVESIEGIAKALVGEGTTAFLATTMTQSPENILKSMTAVKDYMEKNSEEGAEVLGIHLEGPFISPKHIGAQPLEYVASPSATTFEKYMKASGGNIKIVSMAPEMEGAKDLVEYLVKNKVVASVAHTGAKHEDVKKAMEWGMSNITHTYNAQTGLHHRDVGVVGSALLYDELNCELICDTIHLSVPAIKLVVKNKPHDKVTLITDSMRGKYLPDGEFELGGQTVIVKNGEARLVDGTLAGSVLKMNVAIKNLVEKANVTFTDAVDFATVNPAKNLGVFDKMGSIKEGKLANVTIIDKIDFAVKMTIREGKIVYIA